VIEQRLASIAGAAHSRRVLNPLLRRAAILVTILALLAGIQMRVTPMPMAAASPDSGMAGMVSDMGSGACKGCMPDKMAAADCGAICATIVAVLDFMPLSSPIAAPSAWAWSNDPTRAHGAKPDTAPPRS